MRIDLRVAQLLCSRLCHDLVGPAGAVNAGLELAGSAPGGDSDALALAASSGRQMGRRLQFFRIAFGFGGGDGAMTLAEARELAEGHLAGGTVTLDWPAESGADISRPRPMAVVRLVLNVVLLGVGTLPRGGTLSVRLAELGGDLGAAFTAAGPDVRIDSDVASAMAPDVPAETLTARTVHGHLAALLASSLGAEIETEVLGTEARFAVLVPDGGSTA